MNFYDNQIKLLEAKRKELLIKLNTGLSSQEELLILKETRELLIWEVTLKKQIEEKELETIENEKKRLSQVFTQLKDLKMSSPEDQEELIKNQQYTLSQLSKLLPIEDNKKEIINKLESKLKSLMEQTKEFFQSHSTDKKTETNNNILLEKKSQILKNPIIKPIDTI